ncbi:MAG: hypothetical protein FWH56_03470 [Betaproteobacteria bacterium]|nr:hypothetical protein [Betaproteobacteria bacterium]
MAIARIRLKQRRQQQMRGRQVDDGKADSWRKEVNQTDGFVAHYTGIPTDAQNPDIAFFSASLPFRGREEYCSTAHRLLLPFHGKESGLESGLSGKKR